MGRRHTAKQVAKRLERLELVITTKGWSLRIARTFAEREGISLSQVYRDRRRLHERWRDDAGDLKSDEHRTEWIRSLEALGQRAESKGHFGAAMRAKVEIGRALGFYEPEKHEHVVKGKVDTAGIDLTKLDDAELDAYQQLVEKARQEQPEQQVH